jgi:hypothetical protein
LFVPVCIAVRKEGYSTEVFTRLSRFATKPNLPSLLTLTLVSIALPARSKTRGIVLPALRRASRLKSWKY